MIWSAAMPRRATRVLRRCWTNVPRCSKRFCGTVGGNVLVKNGIAVLLRCYFSSHRSTCWNNFGSLALLTQRTRMNWPRDREASRTICGAFGADRFVEGLERAATMAIELTQKRYGAIDRVLSRAGARYRRCRSPAFPTYSAGKAALCSPCGIASFKRFA